MPSLSKTERSLPPLGPLQWSVVLLRAILALFWLCFCVPLHVVWRSLTGRPTVARWFCAGTIRILGARLTITGKPLRSSALFLANHQSWLDILAMGGTSRTCFLSKDEIRRVPLVGWLAKTNDTLFVSREQRLAVAAQVEALRKALIGGRPVTLFPEGTTKGGSFLMPFKPALLRVLEPPPPGIRVQPVLIDFGDDRDELAWAEETGLYNAVRIAGRLARFECTIHYLEPFDPADFPNRKAIAAHAHAEISEATETFIGLARPPTNGYSAAP